jgi:hypothetical protein
MLDSLFCMLDVHISDQLTIISTGCSVNHEYDGDYKGNAVRLKLYDPHSRWLILDSILLRKLRATKTSFSRTM